MLKAFKKILVLSLLFGGALKSAEEVAVQAASPAADSIDLSRVEKAALLDADLEALEKLIELSFKEERFSAQMLFFPFDTPKRGELFESNGWLSYRDLLNSLEDSKACADFEEYLREVARVARVLVAETHDVVVLLERVAEVAEAFRKVAKDNVSKSFYAKIWAIYFNKRFPEDLREKAFAVAKEKRKEINSKYLEKTLVLRKDLAAWIELTLRIVYENLHLPVKDEATAKKMVADLLGLERELTPVLKSLTSKWSSQNC